MMTIDLKTKLILILAGLVVAAALITAAISNIRLATAEKRAADARTIAADLERDADEKEERSRAFEQKAEYLETQLADIQTIAIQQNEQLKALNSDTAAARDRVVVSRRTRSIAATTAELCAKLADLGHACGE